MGKNDYSEYELDSFEKYRLQRSGKGGAVFDYFLNSVQFNEHTGNIVIRVDDGCEWYSMAKQLEEYEEIERKNRVIKEDVLDEDEIKESEEQDREDEEYNTEILKAFAGKFDIDFWRDEEAIKYFRENYPDKKLEPKINALSGADIKLKCGQGILDFIYADFIAPTKEVLDLCRRFEIASEKHNPPDTPANKEPQKIYSAVQSEVELFLDYVNTMTWTKYISNNSLYSAICPPILKGKYFGLKETKAYGNYLLTLQNEYKELIELCYDEDFYPEALGYLMPYERYYIYKNLKDQPHIKKRTETVAITRAVPGEDNPPFSISIETVKRRLEKPVPLNEQHKELAKKYGAETNWVYYLTIMPHCLVKNYEFRSINDILEIEFMKMLEENIRFRKCKRCGKYFIMKGNYDTNYCDRIEPGTTRTCKDLAAQENYKKKTEGNEAIALYQKFYKRYAARVKVRQIKEPDFKKWKYEAIVKRDSCTDGIISVAEYKEWLEGCFPNRKPKQ